MDISPDISELLMESVGMFGIDIIGFLGSVVCGVAIAGVGLRVVKIGAKAIGQDDFAQKIEDIAEATDDVVRFLNPISKFKGKLKK